MTGISATRNGRVRVLIVDDEPGLTELLSVAVTEAGRRPYPATAGRSALRVARGCAPHAVVLDGMPPDLGGVVKVPHSTHGARHAPSPQPPARVTRPSGRLSVRSRGLAEEGARRRLGAGRACDTLLQDHYVQPFHILGLRRKIDKGRAPVIHTVTGVGYAIRAGEDGR